MLDRLALIVATAGGAGFAPVALQRVHLRTEGGKPVEGWLATAQAAASPATDAAACEDAAAQGA